MTTETKTTVSRNDIFKVVSDAWCAGASRGNCWVAVRIGTDGSIYRSMEASPCMSEAEYFGRKPHTVTVWSHQFCSSISEDEVESNREYMDDEWFSRECEDLDITATGCELVD